MCVGGGGGGGGERVHIKWCWHDEEEFDAIVCADNPSESVQTLFLMEL